MLKTSGKEINYYIHSYITQLIFQYKQVPSDSLKFHQICHALFFRSTLITISGYTFLKLKPQTTYLHMQ